MHYIIYIIKQIFSNFIYYIVNSQSIFTSLFAITHAINWITHDDSIIINWYTNFQWDLKLHKTYVLTHLYVFGINPNSSSINIAAPSEISLGSVCKITKLHKFHPYKMNISQEPILIVSYEQMIKFLIIT